IDETDRVFSAERHVVPMRSIQRPVMELVADSNPQGETLVQRRGWFQRVGVMLGAGGEPPGENVPMPPFAVAAEINLACANATDGHPDLFEVRTAIDRGLAALRERLEPFRAQLLISGNQLLKIGACERSGHRRPGLESERSRTETY